jgi:subtilisin family serine protease
VIKGLKMKLFHVVLAVLSMIVIAMNACSEFQTSSIKMVEDDFKSFEDKGLIPAGTSLIVEVDTVCARRRAASASETIDKSFLTSNVNPEGISGIYEAITPSELSLQELNQIASSDECAKQVAPNYEREMAALPSDPLVFRQQHLAHIKLTSVSAQRMYDGVRRNMVVAIIDDGIDITHPDLRDSLWVNDGEIPNDNIDNDGNGQVDDYHGYNFAKNNADIKHNAPRSDVAYVAHGTHVAGLAAASYNNGVGVVGSGGSHVEIMVLHVFRPPGTTGGNPLPREVTNDFLVLQAIQYAIRNGADVINLSLGGDTTYDANSMFITKLREAANAGAITAMAAMNGDRVTGIGFEITLERALFPASYGHTVQGAVTVGAIDTSTSARCGFSNFSTVYVEIAAPGCAADVGGIFSTTQNRELVSEYKRLQGTSMSTPIVAGALALLKGYLLDVKNIEATGDLLETILKSGSTSLGPLEQTFQEGRVLDIDALAREVDRRYPAAVNWEPELIFSRTENGSAVTKFEYEFDDIRVRANNVSPDTRACMTTVNSDGTDGCLRLGVTNWPTFASNTEWRLDGNTWRFIGVLHQGQRIFRLRGNPSFVRGTYKVYILNPTTGQQAVQDLVIE